MPTAGTRGDILEEAYVGAKISFQLPLMIIGGPNWNLNKY